MTPRGSRKPSRRLPFRSQFWLSIGLTLVLHSANPAFADQGLRIVLPQRPLAASDQFTWTFQIQVVNDLDTGIYTDSLICTFEDLDPGTTRASRTRTVSLDQVKRVMRAISGRDSATARYQGRALAEHARLSFLLKAHDGDGRPLVAEADLEIHPGPISLRFPSQFLEEKARRIEYVFLPGVWPAGPSPAVLLVHAEASHARQLLPWAWELSTLGYAVMVVSLPGYGQSTGAPDFAGPATLKALDRALQHLRRTPGVDSTRVALWGISRGATAAALLAANRKDLHGLVLQSGLYDLASAFETTSSEELRASIQSEAGKKGEGWKRRSPTHAPGRLQLPVLLIHGERDEIVPPAQATDLAAALRAAGRTVTLELLPEAGHFVAGPGVTKPALDFLREHLRPRK